MYTGKKPLGKLRRRWEYVKMNLGEIGWGGLDWTDLAHVGSTGEQW